MIEGKTWTQCRPWYNPVSRCVELVDEDGDVAIRLQRSGVEYLLALFPEESEVLQ